MKTILFNSVFAESIEKFIAFKRTSNIAYENGAKDLASFDRFACQNALKDPMITKDLAKRYLGSIAHVTPKTRHNRMCVLRQFSAFHQLSYPESQKLLELGIKKQQSVRFIILKDSDVAELMHATDILKSISHYARAIKCLIGLLYCGALRISEALALDIGDFDPNNATLLVRCGKFRKQRYVPLATSTCTAISDYLTSRQLPVRLDANTPLFADKANRRLTYYQAYGAFNRLLDFTSLRIRHGPVRLHDLRHSFATSVLRQVVQAGGDVYAMLPKLATFMGHVSLSSTQIYLHVDPIFLALASNRFHNAFFKPTKP